MEVKDMGTGKSGYSQPNSTFHLHLFLESAARRELRGEGEIGAKKPTSRAGWQMACRKSGYGGAGGTQGW